jgi:hypothetical protein
MREEVTPDVAALIRATLVLTPVRSNSLLRTRDPVAPADYACDDGRAEHMFRSEIVTAAQNGHEPKPLQELT